MRHDATSVWQEPGKVGYKLHGPRVHNIRCEEDAEDLPQKESIKGGRNGWTKYRRTKRHDEKWSYIQRFLTSRVGKAWDEVYSEICEEADARTWVGQHLRDQLDLYVEQNCFMQNGEVLNEHGHVVSRWWNSFYVHPESKTLEFSKRKSWKPQKDPKRVFDLKGKSYFRWEGNWYRVKFQTAAKVKRWGWYDYIVPNCVDVFLADEIAFYPAWNSWHPVRLLRETYGLDEDGNLRYCVWKQAANSREINQLKKLYGEQLS